jgi:hypothetical protein
MVLFSYTAMKHQYNFPFRIGFRRRRVIKLRKIKKYKCIEKKNIKMYAVEIFQDTKLFCVIPKKWIIDLGHCENYIKSVFF